jgi:hypothetical protein
LFAYLPGVFTRGHDACYDGGSLGWVVQQRLDRSFTKLAVIGGGFDAQGARQTHPIAIVGTGAAFQHEIELNLDDARGVLGTFEIAAHPIQTIANP